jgi:hypothetical protein
MLVNRNSIDDARHTALLYKVLSNEETLLVPPRSLPGDAGLNDLGAAASNPTEHPLVFGTIKAHGKTVGLVEIFQRADAASATQRGYLRFVTQMCDAASQFLSANT